MKAQTAKRISLLGGAFLLAFGSYMWGVNTGKDKIFPYHYIRGAYVAFWNTPVGQAIKGTSPHFRERNRHGEKGVTARDSRSTNRGPVLVASFWRENGDARPEIRLIDDQGRRLHRWRIEPETIWDQPVHDDHRAGATNYAYTAPHGVSLLPNGDLVLNTSPIGLLRVDACAEVKWRLDRRTHHSVYRATDGNFWVSARRWYEKTTERSDPFPGLKKPYLEDYAIEVSPSGEVLREISVLEVLMENDLAYLLPKYLGVQSQVRSGDYTHLNDVETLPPKYASEFDDFEAGDVMLSLRNVNAILVVDPETRRVKYHGHRRLLQHHDPDFLPGGWISVFNNRACLNGPCKRWIDAYEGSEILRIDPDTGESRVRYRSGGDARFYTKTGGKHQTFENGNVLITESKPGRVFEVDSDGEIVWEWIHTGLDDGHVAEVYEGTRYENITRDDVGSWPCAE